MRKIHLFQRPALLCQSPWLSLPRPGSTPGGDKWPQYRGSRKCRSANKRAGERMLRGPGFLAWRRPTFPHSYPCSIIGPARLNYRVRDGNGCDPRGVTTRKFEARERARRGPAENCRERDNRRLAYKHASIERTSKQACCLNLTNHDLGKFYGQAERAISTGQLERIAALPPPAYQGRSLRPPFLSRRSGIGRPYLRASFMLRCIQHLSLPDFATERCRWRDSSYTRGLSIPVLSY